MTNRIIGGRLREPREQIKFSEGEIDKHSDLLRCFISRVECGHTVPAVETLEEFARALEVPIYQLFYGGEELPMLSKLPKRKTSSDIVWGSTSKEARLLVKFRPLCSCMAESGLKLLFSMAQKMARPKTG